MNTYEKVTELIAEWSKPVHGYTKAELAVLIAEACMGWPYVWGGYGQKCTPANRKSYAERSSCPDGEKEQIKKTCQVYAGKKSTCDGCKFYPGACVLFFDCRGFTRWVLARLGINLKGAGATSQWNDASNWKAKGKIEDMPKDQVCCVFQNSGNKMQHTGLYIGNGRIIHCSGTVKEGKITDKGWTHYGIPNGMEGDVPVPAPGTDKPTLRRGSKGEYVTLLQTKLIQLGYGCGSTGADGIYGKATEEAVKNYQMDHGLKVDGICGKNTWSSIDSTTTETVSLYTVSIPKLTRSQAEALISQYAGASMIEERG